MKEIADVTMVTAGSVAKVKQEYREASTRIDQALNTLKGELVSVCLLTTQLVYVSAHLSGSCSQLFKLCVCVREREKKNQS